MTVRVLIPIKISKTVIEICPQQYPTQKYPTVEGRCKYCFGSVNRSKHPHNNFIVGLILILSFKIGKLWKVLEKGLKRVC